MRHLLFYITVALIPLMLCSQEPVVSKGKLPNSVSETSGLLFFNDRLITHNDSGNAPQLFEIDTISLGITRTITLMNAENVDWEDMTQDEAFIYIGDIGNLKGTRRNLTIYKIDKEAFKNSEFINAQRIDFSYEDQINFEDTGDSDWDAEALFALDDALIILTKEWRSKRTRAYCVPKDEGNHLASFMGAFDIEGLVTGATYDPVLDVLHVVGYSIFLEPFVAYGEEITNEFIFGSKFSKQSITVDFAQIESITSVSENRFFMSSEFFMNVNPPIILAPTLFAFNQKKRSAFHDFEDDGKAASFILYRDPKTSLLQYEVPLEKEIIATALFNVSGQQISYSLFSTIGDYSIDLSIYPKGIYYLTFYCTDGIVSKPFIWN